MEHSVKVTFTDAFAASQAHTMGLEIQGRLLFICLHTCVHNTFVFPMNYENMRQNLKHHEMVEMSHPSVVGRLGVL